MTPKQRIITLLIAAFTITINAMTTTPAPQGHDGTRMCNIAYMRPVRTSSTFDYNLTGQLLTDGIVSKTMPPSLSVTTSEGPLPRREREWAIDGGQWTHNTLKGGSNHLQYEWTGMAIHADRIEVRGTVAYHDGKANKGYTVRLAVPGGKGANAKWRVIDVLRGDTLPGTPTRYRMSSDPNKQTRRDFLPARNLHIKFDVPRRWRDISGLRIEVEMDGAAYWNINNVDFYDGERRETSGLLPNSRFGSAWMSDGEGEQWAEVDLGGMADIESVRLAWIRRPRHCRIEVGDNDRRWTQVATCDDKKSHNESIDMHHARGRFVRISMSGGCADTKAAPNTPAYILSELEVYGTGTERKPIPTDCTLGHGANDGGRMSLNGNGTWHVCRASEAQGPGSYISTNKYRQGNGWIPAVVPGTVLTSFVKFGALADPNVADNIFDVSDSYFNSDFWYRRQFILPETMRGKHVILNLDGINWKADVWINGHKADRIEGAFRRGTTDITPYISDGTNTIAVRIVKNAHPGAVKEKNHYNTDYNGGILGADNPTFHATTGWDWISTIRGRDIGIWNDVYITATDDITLSDPLVSTLLDTHTDTLATMTPHVVVANKLSCDVSGTLRGWIGDIRFERKVALRGGETREVEFSPDQFAMLRARHMRLWWPNGYGEPHLYDAGFEFTPDATTAQPTPHPTARIDYKAGIRQVTYADPKTQLKIYVNGQRVTPLGGNWGFPEANLDYSRDKYDTAVRLHRDMNFNMIRNWVGMTGDEDFYDACDKYGIMVWQDFWLANPADGPDPEDEPMFMDNARDFTQRMRRHPSIAIYCGRNEGYPPKTLDDALRQTVGKLNPGLLYISSSADEGVSGHGPYWAEPARTYFARQTGRLHTERGMPNIPSPEGVERTLASPIEWQPADAWGQHDLTQAGAQRGASFMALVERMFGRPTSAEEFAQLAQWENYDGYRAMFEADSRHRQGLLIWMSHPCWPSFTWQCYDYFFEPTAAFFGARKACETLHVQWNALTRRVEIVNRSAQSHQRLMVRRDILDMHGRCITSDSTHVDSRHDSTTEQAALATDSVPKGLDGNVYYIRLTLDDADGHNVSSNFYVLSTDEGNLQQLNTLPQTSLNAVASLNASGMELTLENTSDIPAMMVRLNLKDANGAQVLPAFYSDNYFHLMPGNKHKIAIGSNPGGPQPTAIELSGFNVRPTLIQLGQ